MIGAPSQLDLFEPKPELNKRDNEVCPDSLLNGRKFAFIGGEMRLSGSRFKFSQHGQSGHFFPKPAPLSQGGGRIVFVRSLHTEEINHAPAQIFFAFGIRTWWPP